MPSVSDVAALVESVSLAAAELSDVTPEGFSFTKETRRAIIQEYFAGMVELAAKCATHLGYTLDHVLRIFNNAPQGSRGANAWNIYQRFANSGEFRAGERARIDPAFAEELDRDPDAVAEKLSGPERKRAYDEFRLANPDRKHLDVLEEWDELARLEDTPTIGMRQQHFKKFARDQISMVTLPPDI